MRLLMTKIKKILHVLRTPSFASLGSLVIGGFVAGIIFWGGFNTAMEATNTETFYIPGTHSLSFRGS